MMQKNEVYRRFIELIIKERYSDLDYYAKAIDEVVEIQGHFILIYKPRIKTEFCFGYGFCGRSSTGEEEDAFDKQDRIKSDVEMFKRANLEDIDYKIQQLQENDIYIAQRFSYGNIWGWNHYRRCETPVGDRITEYEKNILVAAYERVRERLEKRLDAYIKRYGLSKVRSWTYLSD